MVDHRTVKEVRRSRTQRAHSMAQRRFNLHGSPMPTHSRAARATSRGNGRQGRLGGGDSGASYKLGLHCSWQQGGMPLRVLKVSFNNALRPGTPWWGGVGWRAHNQVAVVGTSDHRAWLEGLPTGPAVCSGGSRAHPMKKKCAS